MLCLVALLFRLRYSHLKAEIKHRLSKKFSQFFHKHWCKNWLHNLLFGRIIEVDNVLYLGGRQREEINASTWNISGTLNKMSIKVYVCEDTLGPNINFSKLKFCKVYNSSSFEHLSLLYETSWSLGKRFMFNVNIFGILQ